MIEPILDINNLSVHFNLLNERILAVREVSFKIFPNEITAIVGESGSGKSALAKSIVRLLPYNANISNGSIYYNNQNLLELSDTNFRKIRGKEIGIIFQDPHSALNPTMKIGPQICESLLFHKMCSVKDAKEVCCQILKSINIENPSSCFHMYPHQLSGGMKQRVLIAIATVCRPNLLIADEPTTALDITISRQILNLLKKLQADYNLSILFITHDMTVVANLCDKVIVMYAGEIVEMGDVNKVVTNPLHPYTKMLIDSVPTLDKHKYFNRLKPIEGHLPIINEPISNCSFLDRCPYAMPICAQKRPSLSKNNNKTRCWLYDEKEVDRSKVLKEVLQTK